MGEVPAKTVLKFTIGSDGTEVYIKDSEIVKKKGDAFTYFKATVTKNGDNSEYKEIVNQFECTGTGNSQTLNECTTGTGSSNPCTDTLPSFTINYSSGEDDETDTPAGNGKDSNARELGGQPSAVFVSGSAPQDASGISILTDAGDIFTKYTNKATCHTSTPSDPTEPVPSGKTLKFVVGDGTIYLSDVKAVKKNKDANKKAYTYYTVGKTADTNNKHSVYTLSPKYVCDGLNQPGSLNDCSAKANTDPCENVIYKIQYTKGSSGSNPAAKIIEQTGLENTVITILDSDTEANYGEYDDKSDCPTGSDTTPTIKVPAEVILKFEKDSFTYYIKGNDIVRNKGDEYYHYEADDTSADATKTTYSPKGRIQCTGEVNSQTLVECKADATDCSIETLQPFSIKYATSTPPKAEFDSGLTGTITVVSEEDNAAAEAEITKYADPNTCKTESGGDTPDGEDEIDVNDLSKIPRNSQVKSNISDITGYYLLTESVIYRITEQYQLAIPSTKTDTERNSTYKVNEDAEFNEKKTGMKTTSEFYRTQFDCLEQSKKFVSLKWMNSNCNKTKVDEWIDTQLEDVRSNSVVLAANESVVYDVKNSKITVYGNIVQDEEILQDKAWIVYPTLLLSLILIIFF